MSTAKIDWGDGTVEDITLTGTLASWTMPNSQHTYASSGDKTVKVTGPQAGQDTESIHIYPAPTFQGTATVGTTVGSATAALVTIPKPDNVQAGETLVACLRGQQASAAEFIADGWRRISPYYDATISSQPRVTVIMIKPIVDPAAEPANYTFNRTTVERKAGVIFRVAGAGPVQPSGLDTVFGGSGVQASGGTRHTNSYPVATSPSLAVFVGAGEFSASANEVPIVTPSGYTQRGYVASDTNQAISRTSVWVGTRDQAASPVAQADYAINSTSSGLSALALRGPVPYLFATVAAMKAKTGFTWAHRGNSNVYAELSMNAYQNAVARGYAVLEFSLARTSDGVWFGLHDADINRTSGLAAGTLPATTSMTWAEVQTYQNVLAKDGIPRPYLRWEDFRDAYKDTHILVLDPKSSWSLGNASVRNEFWTMCSQVDPSRLICKGYINSPSFVAAASARSYESWGYGYQADVDGGVFAAQQGPWTMLGLEIAATQAAWDTVLAFGKKTLAHIANSQADYTAGMAKGAHGVQVGATAAVLAVNAAT